MNSYTLVILPIVSFIVWYYLKAGKKPYKGTIIFDVDGILLNFYQSFLDHYNKKDRNHKKDLSISDLYLYSLSKTCDVPQQFIDDFHNEEAVANLPLHHPETAEFIRKLRYEGYRIILNTGFPKHHQDKRFRNLQKHGIEYDAIHFQQKKEILDLYSDILCIFEDDPQMIKYYVDLGYKVYVPKRSYLRDEPYLITPQPLIKRYSAFCELYSNFWKI